MIYNPSLIPKLVGLKGELKFRHLKSILPLKKKPQCLVRLQKIVCLKDKSIIFHNLWEHKLCSSGETSVREIFGLIFHYQIYTCSIWATNPDISISFHPLIDHVCRWGTGACNYSPYWISSFIFKEEWEEYCNL